MQGSHIVKPISDESAMTARGGEDKDETSLLCWYRLIRV